MKDETKSEKFLRLSSARLPKIVASIKLLGNLAGPSYAYSTFEAQELVSAIDTAVTDIARRFGLDVDQTQNPEQTAADAPVHSTDRAMLDRSIIQLKIDRAIRATESLPELFKELKEEMGA